MDLNPILVQIAEMQFYFQSRSPDDFREMSILHFQKIYADLNCITDQLKNIAAHEQYLFERWQSIAPYTLRLRSDTESFAKEVIQALEKINLDLTCCLHL